MGAVGCFGLCAWVQTLGVAIPSHTCPPFIGLGCASSCALSFSSLSASRFLGLLARISVLCSSFPSFCFVTSSLGLTSVFQPAGWASYYLRENLEFWRHLWCLAISVRPARAVFLFILLLLGPSPDSELSVLPR